MSSVRAWSNNSIYLVTALAINGPWFSKSLDGSKSSIKYKKAIRAFVLGSAIVALVKPCDSSRGFGLGLKTYTLSSVVRDMRLGAVPSAFFSW